MTKRFKRLLVAGVSVLVLWGAWIVYADYGVPAQELSAMGIDWVKPWAPRTIDRYQWVDGSQVVYTFSISKEVEQALRARCLPQNGAFQVASGSCYLAHRREADKPHIDLQLQNGVIKLYYTG